MNLFIKLQDGQPFEHPIAEENFVLAFPDVDLNNLPDWVARFERVERPPVGMFEVNDGVTYEFVNGFVKDVWHIRAMTDLEQEAKIESIRNECLVNIEALKTYALENANSALTEENRVAWQSYLDELNVFVLLDPFNYQLPREPRISGSGSVLSTTSSGSAPDVIG